MRRLIVQILLLLLCVFRASAQPSLEFFTNKANALLQSAYGFGVTNIPVYSTTDTNVGYTSSIHYLLQSAANLYDAGTPATDFPSVFRPLFGWNSNTLEIIGFTNVTTDFFSQYANGFKTLGDSTISTNDNVWGIPWVVGMKNDPPAFSGFAYAADVFAARKLLFVRGSFNGAPDTNRPPQFTNQFFMMSISNSFGLKAWNFNRSAYTNPTEIIFTNQIFVTLTNNYNWGSNFSVFLGTNEGIASWPGWSGRRTDGSFFVPLITNFTALAPAYWSERQAKMIVFGTNPAFLASDTNQIGWPVHKWSVAITNNLVYALIDTNSGAILDFVNLGGFGADLAITAALEAGPPTNVGSIFGNGGIGMYGNPWLIGNATDAPNSPLSAGLLNQIMAGLQGNEDYQNDLNGVPSTSANLQYDRGSLFGSTYVPSNLVVQSCQWQSANPRVHYTVSDLSSPYFGPDILSIPPFPAFGLSPASYASLNALYNSGALSNEQVFPGSTSLKLTFTGSTNLPYVVWKSTDLIDWNPSDVVAQIPLLPFNPPFSGKSAFQFTNTVDTNSPARFFQIRQP